MVNVEKIRLNKYLAECGICSRREADKIIDAGNVKVNGSTAKMGQKVTKEDTIEVDGELVKGQQAKVVLAFYKPIGITCTEKDKFAEKNIIDYVNYPIRITYAGRLDKESEGLMILTNDGDLIQKMMKATNQHEKEYVVKVKYPITDDFIENMQQGVYLRDLDVTTRACEVQEEEKDTFRIVLTQGMNRQIRRMCEELGQEVIALKRVRVMNVELKGLEIGTYRELNETEREILYKKAGLLQDANRTE